MLREADSLDWGPARLALVEEAVRVADVRGDDEAGFAARQHFVDLALHQRQCDRAGVAFSWLLARHDADPGSRAGTWVLERYFNVVGALSNFPEVPRDRLIAMLDDLAEREERRGASLRAAHLLRSDVAGDLGDAAMARASFQAALRCGPPADAAEKAEEDFYRVKYHVFVGDDAPAAEVAMRYADGPAVGQSSRISRARCTPWSGWAGSARPSGPSATPPGRCCRRPATPGRGAC